MAEPTAYQPDYDFIASDKGVELNDELASVAASTVGIITALQDLRRSDGALQNGIVTFDSLATSALPAFGATGEAVEAAVTAAAGATVSAASALASASAAGLSAGAAGVSQAAAAVSAGAAAASALAASGSASAAAASALAAAAPKIAFVAHRNSVDQTGIVTGTPTKIAAGTEVFDQGGHYDVALARWTPPAGRYQVTATALFTANIVNQLQFRSMLYVNGVLAKQDVQVASGAVALTASVSAILVLNGTDYVEFFVQGDGAGDKTVSGSPVNTWFEGSAL